MDDANDAGKMVMISTARAVQQPITVSYKYNDNDIQYKKNDDGPAWICVGSLCERYNLILIRSKRMIRALPDTFFHNYQSG